MNRTYPHIARTTALALLVALGTACGNDSPIAPAPTPGSGTPVDIGRLEIASTPDAASPATRVSINSLWQNGDAVIVSATKADAGADKQNATYIYNESSKSWALKSGDTPLYVEQISPSDISIETWGGYTDDGLAADPTLYTDQSDPAASAPDYTTGDRYRRNDHLLCSDASLSGRTLNGSLAHLRVDFVLQITDGTDTDRLNILPTNAVLTLNADGKKIIAYREQKTTEGTTNFRAHLKLADVPGISLDHNGTATVSPASLLGTLTYTMGSTPKTLKIRYSITSTTDAGGTGTSGNNIPIVAGKRIVVSATFADLSYLDATATLTPWKDIDGWHAGTEEIGMEITSEKGANGQPIYEIYNAQGLKEFADLVNGTEKYEGKQNTGANVRLVADVDLSSVCGKTKGNWTPIGDSSNPYTGCFDGQGHTVSELYIDNTSSNIGLFGVIGKDGNDRAGSILHLRVKAEKISSNSYDIGVLAGTNDGGIITDCHAMGNVSGRQNTGGLVGTNSSGTITACCATGNVSGTDLFIGGLVGVTFSGTITACCATGSVSGDADTGGLIGLNNGGTITACCATGNVSGTGRRTSGLVGSNYGIITACYATGSATGTDIIGGLVGYNHAIIIACYATGSATGTGNNINRLVGSNNGRLFYCVTTQPTISDGECTNCYPNAKSFSIIRATVAFPDAQNVWNENIDGRLLDGAWGNSYGDANDPENRTAIWKSAVNGNSGTPDDDLLTGGSLHLWWQP